MQQRYATALQKAPESHKFPRYDVLITWLVNIWPSHLFNFFTKNRQISVCKRIKNVTETDLKIWITAMENQRDHLYKKSTALISHECSICGWVIYWWAQNWSSYYFSSFMQMGRYCIVEVSKRRQTKVWKSGIHFLKPIYAIAVKNTNIVVSLSFYV